jgi:cyclomaltodextrinase / maltogenic alpha-amylase / neopullulanase
MVDLSETARNFKHGTYRHFKGGMYTTICIGRSSEDRDQEFVVYKSLEQGNIWIRPLAMFLDEIDREGYKGPRFSYIAES